MLGGFSAGGRISQKINKDTLPPTAYNELKGVRLHVTIINAPFFTTITGRPSPPSPVSAQTYLESGLPWYELYDEHIPVANNTATPTALSAVRSVAEIDRQRAKAKGDLSKINDEELGGVEAGSMDERIVKLKAAASEGTILSFKLKAHAVSHLNGSRES